MQVRYIGKSRNGLTKDHIYEITIKKELKSYVYDIYVWRDTTHNKEEEIDKVFNYASEISIKQNWKIERIELED